MIYILLSNYIKDQDEGISMAPNLLPIVKLYFYFLFQYSENYLIILSRVLSIESLMLVQPLPLYGQHIAYFH